MSNQLGTAPILLVGAGAMAVEYARVLEAVEQPIIVFGRGTESAAQFADLTGIPVGTGPLAEQINECAETPQTAIVTVNAMYLADVVAELAQNGVRRLLVEKPAALDGVELEALQSVAAETGAEIRIGYNRRYLPSVLAARSMVEADGGVLSVKFDFSEPSRRIASLGKPQRELDTWFYGNSSHVVDLAFHFAGPVAQATGGTSGGVSWHEAAGVFVGFAQSDRGALVSWHANWIGPGRWGMEVVTGERRLILQPLETLRIQSHDGFDEVPVELDLSTDGGYKPGLLAQVRAFLFGEGAEHLPTLTEHAEMWATFETVRTGHRPS